MDVKPQRRTRIVDENDPAVMAAAALERRSRAASTASTKSAAVKAQQRPGLAAKRVALVDSTRSELIATNKITGQASTKGGLSKPAVRGKALAAKSSASLATGGSLKVTANTAQVSTQQAEAAQIKKKPAIFRDDQAKGPAKGGLSQAGLGNEVQPQKQQRKRPFVYRDQPEAEPAVKLPDVVLPDTEPVSVYSPPAASVSGRVEEEINAPYSPHTAYQPSPGSSAYRDSTPTPSLNEGWEETLPCDEFTVRYEEKSRVKNFGPKFTDDKQFMENYNPFRRLLKVEKKWVISPRSAWDSEDEETYISPEEVIAETQSARAAGIGAGKSATPSSYLGRGEYPAETTSDSGASAEKRVVPEYNVCHELEVNLGRALYAQNPDVAPIDMKDPMYSGEYQSDIMRHLWELDARMQPDPLYMNGQTELEWHMRATLIDWLTEVHERFQMLPETLFLAVNIIDRFLSKKNCPVDELQLVGIVALLISAKYEEIYPPTLDMLVYMVDEAYSPRQMRDCESAILNALNWEVSAPGPMPFLRYLSTADQFQWDIRALAKYFLEAALMEPKFIGTPWCYIAAASYYLAKIMLDDGKWRPAHMFFSGHCATQLAPAIEVLVEMMGAPEKHHKATFEKYSDKKFKRVATFVERWMVAQFKHLEAPEETKERAGLYKKKPHKKPKRAIA